MDAKTYEREVIAYARVHGIPTYKWGDAKAAYWAAVDAGTIIPPMSQEEREKETLLGTGQFVKCGRPRCRNLIRKPAGWGGTPLYCCLLCQVKTEDA